MLYTLQEPFEIVSENVAQVLFKLDVNISCDFKRGVDKKVDRVHTTFVP